MTRRREGELSEADYRALGQFRLAIRRFLAFSQESAQQHGLTSQQHQALLAIRSHGGAEPMTIGQLAECLLIKNHTAVELVGRLADRGLVGRRHSDEDRRRVLLELKPAGREVLRAISVLNLGELEETVDILSDLLATVRGIEDLRGVAR